jgi:hypothetical protein
MKTKLFLLISFLALVGCKKVDDKDMPVNNVKISLDYKLTPRSDYMTTKAGSPITEAYDAFFAKYIDSRLLTSAHYYLTFEGINHHFKSQIKGLWASKDLVTLPEDTYVVTGKSWPKEYQASGDTCYLAINDTIVIDANTTNIVVKATYDCYLLLFDNTYITGYSITESPISPEPQVTGWHDSQMRKDEKFYHIFCRENNITVNFDLETGMYGTYATIALANYTFTNGKYYYFGFANGSINLQPMNGK